MENEYGMMQDDLLELNIKKQVEYYFSTDNLIKDIYLRKNMITGGWVLLSTIASFRIMSTLTKDINEIIKAVESSDVVEISNDIYIRPKNNPTKWILNDFNLADNNIIPGISNNIIPGISESSNNKEFNSVKRQRAISDLATVLEVNSSSMGTNIGPMRKLSVNNINHTFRQREVNPFVISEEDFHDNEIQSLLVVTSDFSKFSHENLHECPKNCPSMESNKKRNLRSISLSEPLTTQYYSYTETNCLTVRINDHQDRNNSYRRSQSISNNFDNKRKIWPIRKEHVNYFERASSDLRNIKWSYENSCSNDDIDNSNQNQIGYTFSQNGGKRDIQYNSENCRRGFTYQDYTSFKTMCLHDRDNNGKSPSQKMNMLYRFWSFFLREHFNRNLFIEFRTYSLADFQINKRYGIECLFRFYSYGLEKKFRKDIFNHFQTDTLEEYNYGYKYGLEKFWAFLHYSQKKVEINKDLKNILNSYKSLKDFRIDFIPPEGFFANQQKPRNR